MNEKNSPGVLLQIEEEVTKTSNWRFKCSTLTEEARRRENQALQTVRSFMTALEQ